MREFAKIGLATLAFAIVHSALASRQAKDLAGKIVGEGTRDGTYRAFYVAQTVLTFASLLLYGARLPKRTLYLLSGRTALTMRLGQLAGLLHLAATARTIGIARLAGWTNLRAWLDNAPVPAGPIAQGPEMDAKGQLTRHGPFAWSRHPLNFSALPILWFTPHMTTRRLAFNLVSTLYFILGSLHEAARLRHAYGAPYIAYERSGVPFYWPRLPALSPPRSASLTAQAGMNLFTRDSMQPSYAHRPEPRHHHA